MRNTMHTDLRLWLPRPCSRSQRSEPKFSEQSWRKSHSSGKLAHFFLHQILRFSESLIHCGSDQILKHVDVLRIDYGGVYFDGKHFLPAIGDNRYHTAA